MRKVKSLFFSPVFVLEQIRRAGEVNGILVNKNLTSLAGVILTEPGWIKSGKGIYFAKIVSFADGRVTVQDEAAINEQICHDGEVINVETVFGKAIIEETGRHIGIITDILFDEQTGQLTAYEVSDSIIEDIFDGRKTIPAPRQMSVSEDAIVVAEAHC